MGEICSDGSCQKKPRALEIFTGGGELVSKENFPGKDILRELSDQVLSLERPRS